MQVHANGRCMLVLHACMHEIYIHVGALLCFLTCKLAGTRGYLCVKNMNGLDGDTIELKLFYNF